MKPKYKQSYPLCSWCRIQHGKKKWAWYCKRCYNKLTKIPVIAKSSILGGGR